MTKESIIFKVSIHFFINNLWVINKMSFNLSTKINNLYSFVGSKLQNYISATQDSFSSANNQVGSAGGIIDINGFTNLQGTNIIKPVASSYTDTTYRTNTEVQIGTISKPADFVYLESIRASITGMTNPLGLGFAEGGLKIRDSGNNDIYTLTIGTNRDSFGNFTIASSSFLNLKPSQFPLKVVEYIYYPSWFLDNSSVPFVAYITLNYSNATTAYWKYDDVINKFVCKKAGNYVITQNNSMTNNGTGASNLIIATLKNNATYTYSNYDTCGLTQNCNNTQTTLTSCAVNDTISFRVQSSNFCRVITTNVLIQEI